MNTEYLHIIKSAAKDGLIVKVEPKKIQKSVSLVLIRHVPGLMSLVVCPFDHEHKSFWTYSTSLWMLLIHLNDHHEWPREDVADWLESLDVDLTFQKVD